MEYCCIIILVNLLVLFRTIYFDPIIDDDKWYRRIVSEGKIPNIMLDHVKNIFYHTVVCLLIFHTFGANLTSFMAAILMALNPVNLQSSVWLSGRGYAINAIWVLLAWLFRPWGIIFYLPAINLQPSALLTPFLYATTPYKYLLFIVPFVVVLASGRVVNRLKPIMAKIPPGELKSPSPRKVILFIKTFGEYTAHSLLPIKLSFFYMWLESYGFCKKDNKYWYSFNIDFWKGIVIILSIIAVAFLTWGTSLSFGLFWYVLFISQWCHFPITVQQAFTDRYLYLSNVGLMLALASCITLIPHETVKWCLFIIFCTYYLTRNFQFQRSFKNYEQMYKVVFYEFPEQFRARSYMIDATMKKNMWFNAIVHAVEGLHFRSDDCILNILAGKIFMALQNYDMAMQHFVAAENNMVIGREEELYESINQKKQQILKIKEEQNVVENTGNSSSIGNIIPPGGSGQALEH